MEGIFAWRPFQREERTAPVTEVGGTLGNRHLTLPVRATQAQAAFAVPSQRHIVQLFVVPGTVAKPQFRQQHPLL